MLSATNQLYFVVFVIKNWNYSDIQRHVTLQTVKPNKCLRRNKVTTYKSSGATLKTSTTGKIAPVIWVVLTISVISVAAVLFYGYLEVVIDQAKTIFTQHKIEKANLAFVFLASLSIPAYFSIRKNWQDRKTFISISEHHLTVDPCDRRDEFLEVTPSYMQ